MLAVFPLNDLRLYQRRLDVRRCAPPHRAECPGNRSYPDRGWCRAPGSELQLTRFRTGLDQAHVSRVTNGRLRTIASSGSVLEAGRPALSSRPVFSLIGPLPSPVQWPHSALPVRPQYNAQD